MRKAFIAIYAKKIKPWKNLISLNEKTRETEVSGILVLSRWDGLIGFPGGYIEKEEDPLDGVIRETEEEIGFILEKDRIEKICSEKGTYFYAIEEDIETILNIQRNMPDAIDYGYRKRKFKK